MPDWNMKQWDKRPVTFFEALGLPDAKIHWPRLQPHFSKAVSDTSSPKSSPSGSANATGSGGNPSDATAQSNQALGKKMAATYGWTGGQWDALNWIVMHESSWEVGADNPTSGAYGIPQALPGSKMATAGSDWRTNPRTQIAWMLNYIKTSYGTPEKAMAFHEQHGWY